MNVSREMLIAEIESVRKVLGEWLRELRDPEIDDGKGGTKKTYPNGIPKGLSVSAVKGIPVDQLRAELNACAAKLEGVAAT